MMKRAIQSVVVTAALAIISGPALAQDSTTGGVRGLIKDGSTGELVIGATVVATSPSLQGTQAAITEEGGLYVLRGLPPGRYQVTVYYADATFTRNNVLVQLGKTVVVNIRINTEASKGEVITIEGRAPVIDQDSTKIGTTITRDYTENVPTGRTFGAVLGAAAGTSGDLYGTSFGGSTSVENTYIVDGINTTDPGFGLLSTNLPNEFIRETEVITGGYNAEYGRSTGGVINVITKSGSNEFHGSVFAYWTPGALVAAQRETPRAGSAIDRQDNLANAFDIGAEVGGPIVRDRLWFHAGINPSFRDTVVNRIIQTQVDENQDGIADTDENGFTILDRVGGSQLSRTSQTYFYSGKLTGAVSPEHQGSISVMGSPSSRESITSVTGTPTAGLINIDRNIVDVATKWSSKFNDNKTELQAVVGYHGDTINEAPGFAEGNGNQIRFETQRSLTDFAALEGGRVPALCDDMDPNDPYPNITNCPVPFYRTGGVGFLEDTDATRLSAIGSITQRFRFGGHHTFKAGADIEEQGYDSNRRYTGGAWYRQRASTVWTIRRFYTVDENGDQPCGSDIDGDGEGDARCAARDFLDVNTTTRNLGAYAQDSWAILPNLTFNAGIRWEQQQLFTADEVAGQLSPATGEPIPDIAFTLSNNLAPRLGLIYDPTEEGRSKIFGHWGRFYESIPMDINVRAYGGEIININVLPPDGCDVANPLGTCDESNLLASIFAGSGEEMVAPGLRGQYLDEVIVGGEYELFNDFKIGATLMRRDLGRVIEDVSSDGANTYIIANPGEVDEAAIKSLRDEAAAIRMMDPSDATGRAAFREFQADQFEAVGQFDTPVRTYNALQLTAEKRFSNHLMVMASYTYSKTKGNFPGLFSPETGQLDPNLTSMYDLPELMANRYGELAADRPHNIKLDGYYTVDRGEIGVFTFGGRVRATSGSPHNTLGSHSLYGLGESYILPRGTAERSPFTTRFDSHFAYGRMLSDGIKLEAFVDIFNMFNQQPEVDRDEIYTFDDVNPIVGGDASDLRHLKSLGADGNPSQVTASTNPNFGNINARQAPLSMRFGMRLTF